MKHVGTFRDMVFLAALLLSLACSAHAAECAPPEAIEAFESGQAYKEAGRLGDAIAEMERAVAIYPDFMDAWFELYEAYRHADRLDDAIEALEQLVRIDSGAPFWQGLLALHRADAGIPSAAAEALKLCRRRKPGSKRAIAACEEAVNLHTDYAEARYFLGVNYIYAGDEESAKEQLAALIRLDPTQAGMLADSMDVLTDWLTADYKQELQAMFAASTATDDQAAPAKVEHQKFSDQEVSRVLQAYEKQIVTLQNLMADPSSLPKACQISPPADLGEQLKVKLMPLSFRTIAVIKANCSYPGYRLLSLPDPLGRPRGPSEVVKIAANLGFGDANKEHWRVGLYQEWLAHKYCRAECNAMLEFRIDTEIDGHEVTVRALVEILEEVADIGQCIGTTFGETPGVKEW